MPTLIEITFNAATLFLSTLRCLSCVRSSLSHALSKGGEQEKLAGPTWHAQEGVQRKFQMNLTLPSVPQLPRRGAVSNKSHRVRPICRIPYRKTGEFLYEIH